MFSRSLLVSAVLFGAAVHAQTQPDALLSIDQNRTVVIDRIMRDTGHAVVRTQSITMAQLREMLDGLRADELLAASLAGTGEGLRDVIASALVRGSNTPTRMLQAKSLGDSNADVTYTPVTPCRLVDTRGFFSPVYAGGAFSSNEIRTYTIQGGNGACLAQLPAGLNPAALQLQVFAMPTTSGSGDVEILPQGATFGSTATMVYVASLAFNTVSTSAKVNTATNQISIQVRGGGANLAIDVVGYFKTVANASGAVQVAVGGEIGFQLIPDPVSSIVLAGAHNFVTGGAVGAVVAGGGAAGPVIQVGSNTFSVCASICGNRGTDIFSTVSGGAANRAGNSTGDVYDGSFATVAGGYVNVASGSGSAVSGGQNNTASGTNSAVAGGSSNVASGTHSMAAGGVGNSASGSYSFAAGNSAVARGSGEFVWSDSSGSVFDPSSIGSPNSGWANPADTFNVRALGGVWFVTGWANGQPAAGPYVNPGSGVWGATSDRAVKENFRSINAREVLEKVTAMPIATWNYITEGKHVRHLGPVSQDFYEAFALGPNDKSITSIDETGVALAAIQGLNAKLEQLIAAQELRITAQEREIYRLRAEVARTRRMPPVQ